MCPFHVAVWTSSHHGSWVPREREREEGYRQKPCLLCDVALEIMQYHFQLILFIKAITKSCPTSRGVGVGNRFHFLMERGKLPQEKHVRPEIVLWPFWRNIYHTLNRTVSWSSACEQHCGDGVLGLGILEKKCLSCQQGNRVQQQKPRTALIPNSDNSLSLVTVS